MSVRRAPWPPGTPCWVDLGTADPAAAADFYAALFGWEIRLGPPAAGGYRMALLRDCVVAGIRPQQGPAAWTTYLASRDAGVTCNEVVAAGGRVVAPPVSLLSEGALALVQDPTGVPFGVWEPGELLGAELVNEPGSFCWPELLSADLPISRAFHLRVFGFATDDRGGPDFAYEMIRVGDATVGGMAAIGPPASGRPQPSPQWLVYFSVDDTDGVTDRARFLGAQVQVAPTDTRHGRMALLSGRLGETFGVLQADDLPQPPVESHSEVVSSG